MMMTKRERALALTADELNVMSTGSLTAVAQTLGTSGKYDDRTELIKRIKRQQEVLKNGL